MPLDLSVAIACKNNADTIEATLHSVRDLASEIVAVDNGSTDSTISILEKYGAKVIRSEWLGHVKTKQKALVHTTRTWTLCLDSDESVQEDLRRSIEQALEDGGDKQVAGFEVNRKVWYEGGYLNYAWQPEWRLRLVRRERCAWGGMDPHDKMMTIRKGDRVERLAGVLRHDSFTTIEEQFRKQVGYARISAQGMVAAGDHGSYWKLFTSPPAAFLKQIVVKQAFRDGWRGWAAAATTAALAYTKHALVLEVARGAKKA